MPSNYNYWEESDRSWSEQSIWISHTPSHSIRRRFFYVEEIGYFQAYPSYYTRRANLNSFLICHTLSGKGVLKIADKDYSLLPGTTAWINCTIPHYYACAHPDAWEFLWFHFNGPCALGYYEEFVKNGYQIFQESDNDFTPIKIRNLLNTIQKKKNDSDIIASGIISELLTHLLVISSDTKNASNPIPSYIEDSIKKINIDFQFPLTLDALSHSFGVSKYHFSREFKRYTNMSPNEYLITTRLNYAKELLKYSSLSVEQVAYQCGFHHLSYFAKQFRKHENVTPLQFRKNWKNDFS